MSTLDATAILVLATVVLWVVGYLYPPTRSAALVAVRPLVCAAIGAAILLSFLSLSRARPRRKSPPAPPPPGRDSGAATRATLRRIQSDRANAANEADAQKAVDANDLDALGVMEREHRKRTGLPPIQ